MMAMYIVLNFEQNMCKRDVQGMEKVLRRNVKGMGMEWERHMQGM